MRSRRCLALLCCALLPVGSHADVIHVERSLYENLLVQDSEGRRCLGFRRNQVIRNQSCMDLNDSKRLVIGYVRMLFGTLLLNPKPKRILVIGLGGGTIPVALNDLFPKADIQVVEVDEAVLRVARAFFNFKVSDRLRVEIVDVRVFARRAVKQGKNFDLILLDAFNGDYIPEHLMTREFLEDVRSLLSPDGVLGANTYSGSRLYDNESVTYTSVFRAFFNFRMPGTKNRVIITSRAIAEKGTMPPQDLLIERSQRMRKTLTPFGIDVVEFPPNMNRTVDWKTDARELTDQYSPANLLNRK